jgi:hypothetical protein
VLFGSDDGFVYCLKAEPGVCFGNAGLDPVPNGCWEWSVDFGLAGEGGVWFTDLVYYAAGVFPYRAFMWALYEFPMETKSGRKIR